MAALRKRKSKMIILLSTIIAMFLSCSKPKKLFTIIGSTAFQPFCEKLADIYTKSHPDVRINIQGGGSIVGIQAMLSNAAEIAMADLATLPNEVTTDEFKIFHVASDGIAIIVHPSNTVTKLTLEEVKKIYTGEITNWKEVGGVDKEIVVVSREKGSGTGKSFEDIVLKGAKLRKDCIFQDSNGTVRETVKNTPQAIGYIFMGLLNKDVKPVMINNVLPNVENVKSGKYFIQNKVYFILRKTVYENNPSVKDFIEYVLNDGQKVLESEGLVPVK